MSAQPPPLPPIDYRGTPRPSQPGEPSQTIFDRVAGPNLRLTDNLIQLACVVVGAAAGALIGRAYFGQSGLALGLIAGLLGAVLLSGLTIGIIRFIRPRR